MLQMFRRGPVQRVSGMIRKKTPHVEHGNVLKHIHDHITFCFEGNGDLPALLFFGCNEDSMAAIACINLYLCHINRCIKLSMPGKNVGAWRAVPLRRDIPCAY